MQQAAFDSHPLWASTDRLQALIDKADKREEPSAAAPLSDVRYLASILKSHRKPGDTAPYSKVTLDSINSNLTNVLNEVKNYVANGNVGHLTNAENHAQQVLHGAGLLPAALLKGGAAGQANKVFKEYRDDATQAIAFLREQNVELRHTLEASRQEFNSALELLKADIRELSAKIKQDEARLDKALTTNNEAFSAKQNERDDRFKEFIKQQGEALKGLAADDLETIGQNAESSRVAYEQIDGLREGTEKVAGLASADILAGKFKDYSEKQWSWGVAANVLGFLTLAVGLGVIAWTLSAVGADESISWQYTTLKLGVTVTIVAASAVAFRLGAIFLSRSGTSKRMELELRAIGPFFADIEDPEAVKEAKRAFVERSFGRGWGERPSDGQPPNSDMASIAKELVEVVRTVTTRTPSS